MVPLMISMEALSGPGVPVARFDIIPKGAHYNAAKGFSAEEAGLSAETARLLLGSEIRFMKSNGGLSSDALMNELKRDPTKYAWKFIGTLFGVANQYVISYMSNGVLCVFQKMPHSQVGHDFDLFEVAMNYLLTIYSKTLNLQLYCDTELAVWLERQGGPSSV